MELVLAVAVPRKASATFFGISGAFPSKLVEIAKLDPNPSKKILVVVDMLGATSNHVSQLRALKQNSNYTFFGFADFKNRQQIKQAREIGCNELIDRTEILAKVLFKLQKLLGDYAKPDLDGKCTEEMAESVKAACVAFSQLSVAALSDDPLPITKLEHIAKDIANSIEAEGLNAWLAAVEMHHSHTFCHSMMVTGHATHFARVLGLPEKDQILLGLGAMVHDVGKVRIPLSILDKPGKLTDSERQLVQTHPVHSKKILSNSTGVPAEVYEMAVWHHEMLDGSGYPDGLCGDEISQFVRIMTICDIYSALTEKRAYKEALSPRQAFSIMLDMGEKLDGSLLKSFREGVLPVGIGELKKVAS